MTSTGDLGPIWVIVYVLLYLAILFAACVVVVKGVRWTRRWWRRRKGLPEEPET